MEQLKKLQSLVTKSTLKAAQSGTCVMVRVQRAFLLFKSNLVPSEPRSQWCTISPRHYCPVYSTLLCGFKTIRLG